MHRVKGVSLAIALVGLTLASTGEASSAAGPAMQPANNDMSNIPSLQRGAANFMNYCSGCHSAQYVRFNSMGADLELSETQLLKNLFMVVLIIVFMIVLKAQGSRTAEAGKV